ncbi:protein of unknown function [Hyphomicrobium sp. 1Nfss2.1]
MSNLLRRAHDRHRQDPLQHHHRVSGGGKDTSGLALPKPLVQAFNWPAIASRVTVDGVITVVDSAAVADGPSKLENQTGTNGNPVRTIAASHALSPNRVCARLPLAEGNTPRNSWVCTPHSRLRSDLQT